MSKLRILILLITALFMGSVCAIECNETPESYEITINNTLHYDFVGPTGGYTEHIEKKICMEEYVQPCEWRFDYSPNFEELSVKDCYVIHGGKKLGCNEPMKRMDVYEWSGTSTLAVSSRSCVSGDIYRIVLSDKYRVYEENAVCTYMGDYDYAEYQKFEVEYPLDSEVTYTSSFGSEPEIIEGKDTKLYIWRRENQEPAVYEDFMPPSKEVFDYICVSNHKNFTSYGDYMLDLFEDKLVGYDGILNKSIEIVGNSTGEEAIEKIYKWVRDYIQYVPLEYGVLTGVEPHTPEEVLKRGNGDCKDQSVLLGALLKAQGFEAEPALFGLANDSLVIESFNHVITKAVYNNKTIWMDPTCRECPYGFLPKSEYGMYVLPFVSSDELERLPEYEDVDIYVWFNSTMTIDESGDGQLSGIFEMGGIHTASAMRAGVGVMSEGDMDDIVGQFGAAICPNFEDPKMDFLNLEDEKENLVMNISVKCKGLAEVGNYSLTYEPQTRSQFTGYAKSDNRSNDLYLGMKMLTIGNSRIVFPEGYNVVGGSDELNISTPYYQFVGKNTVEKNTVESYVRLYFSERIPKGEYNKFSEYSSDLERAKLEIRAEKPVPKEPEIVEEEPQDYSMMIILITIIVGVIAVVVILFLYKKSQPEGVKKLEIVIRDLVRDGESPEEIRKAMKDAGYSDNRIEEVISFATK
jgi:hypothetical protein